MQNDTFDKKSKKFFTIFFSIIMISIVITYYKYVINKNYDVFISEEEIPSAIINISNLAL